jgi:hypothetical protein
MKKANRVHISANANSDQFTSFQVGGSLNLQDYLEKDQMSVIFTDIPKPKPITRQITRQTYHIRTTQTTQTTQNFSIK